MVFRLQSIRRSNFSMHCALVQTFIARTSKFNIRSVVNFVSKLPVRAFAIISYLHRRRRHFKLFGNFPCRSHTYPPNVCNTRHGMFQTSKAALNSLSSYFQSDVRWHRHCHTQPKEQQYTISRIFSAHNNTLHGT